MTTLEWWVARRPVLQIASSCYHWNMTPEIVSVVLTGGGVLLGVWRMLAHYEARNDAAHAKLGQRIDAVSSKLGQRIDAVRAELGARLDSGHAELGGRIDAVNGRIDTVNGRMDTLLHELAKRG